MPRAVATDITRGRSRAVRTEVQGLRELEMRARDLILLEAENPSQGSRRLQQAQKQIQGFLGDAAFILKREVQARAASAGWPRAVVAAVFTYADLRNDKRKRKAALAGIRKGAPPRRDMQIYREWYPGRSRSTRAKSLVLPGTKSSKGEKHGLQKIGMSLASMFEFGTSKMKPRPAFRPALKATQAEIIRLVANGYRSVIEFLCAA